jgi:hypothetical protein
MAFPRGKLLEKNAYYSILIVLRDGSEWRAENFWLEPPGYSAVIDLAVSGGKLKRLKQVQQLPRPSAANYSPTNFRAAASSGLSESEPAVSARSFS